LPLQSAWFDANQVKLVKHLIVLPTYVAGTSKSLGWLVGWLVGLVGLVDVSYWSSSSDGAPVS
jgi:hypothetical protein